MIFLLTRPFVMLFKLLKAIVKAPFKAVSSRRDRKARKNAKFAAAAIKQQQAEAARKQPVP